MKRIIKILLICLSLFMFVACSKQQASQEVIVPKDEITALGRDVKAIEKYIETLNENKDNLIEKGVIVTSGPIDSTGSYDNLVKFMNKVNNKEETSAIFASVTDEGDYVYYYVNYNTKDYYILHDTRFDKFGNYGTLEYSGKYIVFDETKEMSYVIISDIKNFTNEDFFKMVMSSNSKDSDKLSQVKMWVVIDHK